MTYTDTAPSADRPRSYDGGYMEAGRTAEKKVMAWLERQPWVLGLDDLRSLRPLREADVDLGIKLIDGRATLAEIKSDNHLGIKGNFLFEALRINHTAPPDRAVTLGWSARSPARWLLYYAPSFDRVYQIEMDDFRAALQDYTREIRKKSRIDYVETDKIKSTVNVLIPEKFVTRMQSYRVHDISPGLR
tara:strand:- start:2505 stop:3071 length:567 start_codon:yes stop_codon:yes gene_type:complete